MGAPGERVVIIGQGYVGLGLAVRAVEVGHDVVAFDVDESRLLLLAGGESYVEDVSSDRVAGALATGRFRPPARPADLADFDIAVITVQTPLRDGVPDLSFVEDAGRVVASHLRPGACVVLESTTYPGTTQELLAPLLEAGSGLRAGVDFHLGYSPERIDPGNETWTLVTTPKVVSGIDAPSLARVQAFYDTLVERTVAVRGTSEAELTKLLENTFRHVNIALVNELAVFAADLGIDVWEAIDAAATKPFGYLRFTPGPGVGGHCLPVDPTFLSWKVERGTGDRFRFVELANEINARMPDYVVRRVTAGLAARDVFLHRARVLLVGLAFKANTADARGSPAVRIAQLLVEAGAEVHAADPHVVSALLDLPGVGVSLVELTPAEVEAADAVVVVTDHAAFDFAMLRDHASYVLDTRHRVPA
ncbi:MAG: nucleotide sugar dehydrogenase, partial [Acidimicrobiia bacterium]|nr:nucleotide sugar dehydrogenase [Acidimicrobiia bacterium]